MPTPSTLIKSATPILVAALAMATPALAEDYPARTVTLVIPYPAGGGVDTVDRIIAQKLTAALGQQVVVENRPGAGSVIGTRAAVKAPPDGYTLLMITTGLSLSANPGYDVTKDFAPIGTIASIPIVVMANASVPVKTLSDVIALAKREPGKVTIGSPPPPTLNYFGAEQFKAIYAYSPLQNLKPGTRYPPTMITTADHDDRVWPGHSFKFAATMQADQAGAAPILIRIETKAGHGGGKPTSKTIEELADRWAFLVKSLDMRGPS